MIYNVLGTELTICAILCLVTILALLIALSKFDNLILRKVFLFIAGIYMTSCVVLCLSFIGTLTVLAFRRWVA